MSVGVQAVFDPSGSLLATAVVSLSSHKVQVQSVKSSASSSLATSFVLDKGVSVTALVWGSLAASQGQSLDSLMLIVGTSDGKILLYSPSNNALIDTLYDELYGNSIVGVHYSEESETIWSVDSSNNVAEWSLATFKKNITIQNILKNSISGSSSTNDECLKLIKLFSYNGVPHLIASSHKVYIYNLKSRAIVHEISNHITPINQLLLVEDKNVLLTSATADRFINAYDISSKFKPIQVLVTQANVESISFGSLGNSKVLTAVTEDGVCEAFYNPLELVVSSRTSFGIHDGTTRRKKRQSHGNLSKTSTCQIKLVRPETDSIKEPLPVLGSFVSDNQILVAWFENATIPYFDYINWWNLHSATFSLEKELVLIKPKPLQRQVQHSTYSHDVAASNLYNESNVFLTVGDNYRDLDEDEDFAAKIKIDQNEEETFLDDDPNETLGEKLSSLNPNSKILKKHQGLSNDSSSFDIDHTRYVKPTTGSLTIVLTQALKSNDHSLLETVLSTKDESVIQQTIKNLNSELSIILLDKLSEKYNFVSSISAPTLSYQKQIQLNYWIKWVLIIHGSYLKINEINKNSNNITNKQLLKNLSFLLINLNKKSAQLSKILLLQNKLNLVFEKVNYKNELLRDLINPNAGVSKSNKKKADGIIRYDDASDDEYPEEDVEESDVEYNEQLDDADLMDDGEEDFSDDEDQDHQDYMEIDASDQGEDYDDDDGVPAINGKIDAHADDEYGNSDVEVGITNQDEEMGSDDEETKQYHAKIQKLKNSSKIKKSS